MLHFLPPYSPDFIPIEKAFARLKAMLRKVGERTVNGLWDQIGKLRQLVAGVFGMIHVGEDGHAGCSSTRIDLLSKKTVCLARRCAC